MNESARRHRSGPMRLKAAVSIGFRSDKLPLLASACVFLVGAMTVLWAGETFRSVGVALTPAHFPQHSDKDIEDMFRIGRDIGDSAVFIYQWSQPDFKTIAAHVMEMSHSARLKPIIAISPTKLEGMRGDLDVPQRIRAEAGRNLSFGNKVVYQAYIADVLDLARLKPPYLCLATEINLLAFKNIKEYVTFAHVYKELYPLIKRISPATQVFVSFQWDVANEFDRKEPGKIQEHSKLIDIFRPELDLVAFTTYPANLFGTVSNIPADYYERIYKHISRSDHVAFMEVGWSTSGKGSEQSQLEFIQRLPSLMANVRPEILDWSLLHDVGGSGLTADLASTGLITGSGQHKAAYDAFKALKDK